MSPIHPILRSLLLIPVFLAASANCALSIDDPASAEKEQQLLAILRSDAPAADKAIACKNLAIYGSAAAVPDLAQLLPDPQLSSWARIALEAIPGDQSDAALRTAAGSLDGRLLVGMINSIGVRRDAGSVDVLTRRLNDSDVAVASAAAVALGRVGNPQATKTLRSALASAPAGVRSAVAEGCVLCAEQRMAQDKLDEAIEIYDAVRQADVPMQRIIEATRGAILARKQDGIPLLVEAFRSNDKKLFQLALQTVREFPGSDVDTVLATELRRAAPQHAALIVQAMADRPVTVDLAAIRSAAEQGDRRVRLSAIDALRRVGDDSCLPTLLATATGDDAELADAAKQTLADLSGDSVNEKIVQLLKKAEGNSYPLLLELVAQRRIAAVPEVLKALEHSNDAVRRAALIALGETVTLDRLPLLVSQTVTSRNPEDAQVAQRALKTACVRMPDREACAMELAAALKAAPRGAQSMLLEILSDVGGAKALQTLAMAAKSTSPELQDTSSRLLGKWNSVAAAPVLLDLAISAPEEKYKVRALRGYIGLARKFAMPDTARAEMCQNALDSTNRASEHKLVLDVLQLHPSAEGLAVAVQAAKIAGLKNDASAAALVIAQKIGGKGADVSKLLAGIGLERVKLEILKAEYGAGTATKDVTAIVRKQAGDLPLISLGSKDFNQSFGGDPAPGVVKRLKIQYRMDGKVGEASFAENALIILPTPE